jgi:hypothetical protein
MEKGNGRNVGQEAMKSVVTIVLCADRGGRRDDYMREGFTGLGNDVPSTYSMIKTSNWQLSIASSISARFSKKCAVAFGES